MEGIRYMVSMSTFRKICQSTTEFYFRYHVSITCIVRIQAVKLIYFLGHVKIM